MRHMTRFLVPLTVIVVAALGLVACGGDSSEEAVSGSFQPLPGAPAAYDKVSGEAEVVRGDDGTTVTIDLSGLQAGDEYMAHLHSGSCEGPDPGGPHFQFDPSGSEQPPNEIHLSLKANEAGEGSAEASNPRQVPDGEAGSVVLHLADSHSQMALLVHEGKEDDGKGRDGDGGGGHGHGGDGGEAPPDKIACAELEGGMPGASASVPTIEIQEGEPIGGVQQLEYSAGEEIRFRVESDVADEVHVHGYDISKDVPAGGDVSFSFPAEIEGIFEVELEQRAVQIAELQVNP